MKVTKEEQAFWDQVFTIGLTRLLDVGGMSTVKAVEEASCLADIAVAARRARSQ